MLVAAGEVKGRNLLPGMYAEVYPGTGIWKEVEEVRTDAETGLIFTRFAQAPSGRFVVFFPDAPIAIAREEFD